MSDESIEDLFEALPPGLLARKAELEALADGTLPASARARLEAAAAEDEDLAFALELYRPCDDAEMASVRDKIAAAAPPRPKFAVIDGDGAARPSRDRPAARLRGPALVVGMLAAAAAAVVIGFQVQPPPRAPFEVRAGPRIALRPTDPVRVELLPRGAVGDAEAVTVLSVSGDAVHRAELPVRKAGDVLVLEARAKDVVGKLVGRVHVLVLTRTDTDPLGRIEPDEVRQMIDKLGGEAVSTDFVVEPPGYTLALAVQGPMRAAKDPELPEPSTGLEVPGLVTFNLRPEVSAEGAVSVHVFVARDGAAPVPVQPDRVRSHKAAFLVELSTKALLDGAQKATVYLLVGPTGLAAPDPVAAPAAPWRRVVHDVFLVER